MGVQWCRVGPRERLHFLRVSALHSSVFSRQLHADRSHSVEMSPPRVLVLVGPGPVRGRPVV